MWSQEKRIERIKVFEDTQFLCKTDKVLLDAIRQSNQRQYILYETEPVVNKREHQERTYQEEAVVIVTRSRSFEAAQRYKGMKTCVLNFASATSPGGGVVNGASAQEECLCRCSTLYLNLSVPQIRNAYHDKHNQELKKGTLNVLYNDDCIYTPDVVVLKTDTDCPKTMEEKDWYPVDIITCAAPNLGKQPSNRKNHHGGTNVITLSDEALYNLYRKRAKRILNLAKSEGEEVVILGAFGCGAFHNPPEIVAKAMMDTVAEFLYDFRVIEFAVYCSSRDSANYDAFSDALQKKKNYFTVTRIDDPDFGCEGVPEGTEPMATVFLKDGFGKECIIQEKDALLYERNVTEGDRVAIRENGIVKEGGENHSFTS